MNLNRACVLVSAVFYWFKAPSNKPEVFFSICESDVPKIQPWLCRTVFHRILGDLLPSHSPWSRSLQNRDGCGIVTSHRNGVRNIAGLCFIVGRLLVISSLWNFDVVRLHSIPALFWRNDRDSELFREAWHGFIMAEKIFTPWLAGCKLFWGAVKQRSLGVCWWFGLA